MFNNSYLNKIEYIMNRSLNIPLADKEIWEVIAKILSDSCQIKELFISKYLLGNGLNSKQIKGYIKESNFKLKTIETRKNK